MKKFILLPAVILLATACRTDGFDYSMATDRFEDVSMPVALDDAIENMYSLMDSAYGPDTRAARRTVADVSSFMAAGSGISTRGGGMRELAYVVNFEEGGFAVLGARSSVPEVICVTDEGLFEPGEVEELARELAQQTSSEFLPEKIGSADPIRFIKKEVLAHAMHADTEAGIAGSENASQWERHVARLDGGVDETPWTEWDEHAKAGPLLETLWNQSYPYNKECPPDPTDHSRTSYTGCVATALSQIIACNEQPAPQNIAGNTESTWDEIKEHYYNPSRTALRTMEDETIEDDMAAVVRSIGNGVDMSYSYFHGSAASSSDAEKYLKNLNYDRVRRKIWYNSIDITDMLEGGKPVYISAAGDGGAHAWVIDGAVHQKRTRTVDGKTYTQRRFMLHCNFGWGGTANGYYFSKTFSPDKGPVDTETGFDAQNPGTNARTYNRQYQILEYEL